MKQIELFTDGACSGNPGPGGWGAILRYGGREKELSGGAPQTTNNRMELTAVIEGLAALRESCAVTVVSDSRYVVDGIEKGWAKSWKRNGWRLTLLEFHQVGFRWVHGHQGHPENERCDQMAVMESQKYAR